MKTCLFRNTVFLFTLIILLLLFLSPSYAHTWVQTDWSGGVGESTSNQFFSSNLKISDVGQISLNETTGWFDSDWAQRKLITISNTESLQTNYQVRLTIAYDNDMQSDFSDLRFTNADGEELDYWLQSKIDGNQAIVWVEVDTLAAGDTSVYMYYGNDAADSSSDGQATFLLFDDFDDNAIDAAKWTIANPLDDFNEQGGELVLGQGSSNWSQAIFSTASFARSNLSFEMDYKWVSNNPGNDALMMGWKDHGTGASYTNLVYGYYNAGGGGGSTVSVSVYEDGSSRGNKTGSWTQNIQYSTRIRIKATGGAYYEQSINGFETVLLSYDSSYSIESSLHPGLILHSGLHRFDNVKVRQWMVNEPSSSFGSEEKRLSDSGSLISNIYDTGDYGSYWSSLTYATDQEDFTEVFVRTSDDATMAGAPDFAICDEVENNSDLSNNNCVSDGHRYIQYLINLAVNGNQTPTFDEISLGFVSTQVQANAGADQIVVAGRAMTLDGTNSIGQNLTYLWAIFDGVGSLENETTATPTFRIPSGVEGQSVEIGLTVFDEFGKKSTDTVMINVIAETRGMAITYDISGAVNGIYLTESMSVDQNGVGRIELQIGEQASLLLPEGTAEYTFDAGSNGRLMIGVPTQSQGAGNVFILSDRIAQISGTLDLNISGNNASVSQLSYQDINDPLAMAVVRNIDYAVVAGQQVEDYLGQHVSVIDFSKDGDDEFVISAPGYGNQGALYFYNSDETLIGVMLGNEPLGSVLKAELTHSDSTDLILGPNNPALNPNLNRSSSFSVQSSSSIMIYSGDTPFDGVTSPSVLEPDITIEGSNPYQSLAVGDMSGDGNQDIILASSSGTVYVYFGRLISGNNLDDSDAQVVVTGGKVEDGFGLSMVVGDINGDGFGDLMIGAPDYGENDTGAIYCVFGNSQWNSTVNINDAAQVLLITGNEAGDSIGSDLLLADTDSNGAAEIYSIVQGGDIFRVDLTGALQSGASGGDDGEEDGGAVASSSGGGCSLTASQQSKESVMGFAFIGLIFFAEFLFGLFVFGTSKNLPRCKAE